MFTSALKSVVNLEKHPRLIWILAVGLLQVVLFATLLPQGCEIRQGQVTSRRELMARTPAPTPAWGMWVWKPTTFTCEDERTRLIQFCRDQGMNRLLLQVHFDPDSVSQGQPQLLYTHELAALLRQAAHAGIAVEALDGEPAMALAENHPTALAKLQAVLAFNRTLPVDCQFAGAHYDIEPYTLKQWNSPQRQEIMTQYLDLMAAFRQLLDKEQPAGLLLGASIPFWYDLPGDDNRGYDVDYQGQTKSFHKFIQDTTDYVAVMSYRTAASGKDSIAWHLMSEIAYAEQIGKTVCAGMETVELQDTPDITFWDHDPSEFFEQLNILREVLHRRTAFGGIMIHEYPTCTRVMDRTPNHATANAPNPG